MSKYGEMTDFQSAAARGAPLPTTLEDALKEIETLRLILFRERRFLVEKVQEIQDLKNQVAALEALGPTDCLQG